jgi:epoxyqueuosine reductase
VPSNRAGLRTEISTRARELGFDLVGFTHAGPPATSTHLQVWLDNDFHGEMAYLARPDAVAKRKDLSLVQGGVRSVVTVGVNYHTFPLPAALRDDPARGIVASYAWGRDYHDILLPRLRDLGSFIEDSAGGIVTYRAYVDTGPVLERDLAARAGLGFIGRNTNLIHPGLGSWLFLGELLLTAELSDQAPRPGQGTCGRCTRCLDACPTSALVEPYVLDARRCISYLTIELRGPIPKDLRSRIGNRIFGCDVCQEVCPWNRRFARATYEPGFQPGTDRVAPRLLELVALDEEAFKRRFHDSPLLRPKRIGLIRNILVALGNWADPVAIPPLASVLQDPEPLLRGHAAWALGCIREAGAQAALAQALATESNDWVRQELQQALVKNFPSGRGVV